MVDWSVTKYESGDEKGIFELWRRTYPKESPPLNKWLRWWDRRDISFEEWLEWWRWYYQDNPTDKCRIWLAKSNGRVVGQTGLITVRMKIDEQEVLASQTIDVMTDPDYRRQGIFTNILEKSLAEAKDEGIALIFGFPNRFSEPGVVKIGWSKVGTMELMIKPLNWVNSLKLGIENNLLAQALAKALFLLSKGFGQTQKPLSTSELNVKQVSTIDDRFDSFWKRVSKKHRAVFVKDKDYLKWRYCDAPNLEYLLLVAEKGDRIAGYTVLRIIEKEYIKAAVVYELMAANENIAHHLVWNAVKKCKDQMVDFLAFSWLGDNSYRRVFKKCGFLGVPFQEGPPFYLYPLGNSLSDELVNNHQNWLVQIGDTDRT